MAKKSENTSPDATGKVEEKNLLKIASSQIGVKEIKGSEHNPFIEEYARRVGITVDGDETPWCSTFVNWCAAEAGLQTTNKANARSWLYVGRPVEDPRPGDIVIFWRESPDSWKGHVGIFWGYSKDGRKVFVLGGNQGDKVSVAAYDAKKILGFRRLTTANELEFPEPVISLWDRGNNVKQLQIMLDQFGYDPGQIDGVFGPNTQRNLLAFQKKEGLKQSGVYDQQTFTHVESKHMS